MLEVGKRHLEGGADSIISFGQGCEGEPTTAPDTIREAVLAMRRCTDKGTINMNTNAGNTRAVELLCGAGLDSIRVSLISAREDVYKSYYRPRGYSLGNVGESLRAASRLGVYTSLNLLVFPGLTDREEEVEALVSFIRENGVKLVQLRNLNIDPDYLFNNLPPARGEILGIKSFFDVLKSVPGIEIGNFSRPVR